MEIVYLCAKKVMTDDINIAGGLSFQERFPPSCQKNWSMVMEASIENHDTIVIILFYFFIVMQRVQLSYIYA